jgi:hypothetical protein
MRHSEKSPESQLQSLPSRETFVRPKPQGLMLGQKSSTPADAIYELAEYTDQLLKDYAVRKKDEEGIDSDALYTNSSFSQIDFKIAITKFVDALSYPYREFPENKNIIDMLEKIRSTAYSLAQCSFVYAMQAEWKFAEVNKAERMRAAKLTPEQIAYETALVEAIKAHLSSVSVEQPYKLADSIRAGVNACLESAGHPPASTDQIYRRITPRPSKPRTRSPKRRKKSGTPIPRA